MSVNPITGLTEEHNNYFDLPLVHQNTISSLTFAGQLRALHKVPLGSGRTLDFYADLHKSDEIYITLHGANKPDKNRYPRFERIQSVGKYKKALIAFADPTVQMGRRSQMLLGWYLGGAGWDPIYDMASVVRRAQSKVGTNRVVLIAGSGGGHAALRLGALIPGSLVYLQQPVVTINNSNPRALNNYFKTMWPGYDPARLMNDFPERFNMIELYRRLSPDNYVYYIQTYADLHYLNHNYKPFKKLFGIDSDSGTSANARRKFTLFNSVNPGHGTITAEEFDTYFTEALKWWRALTPR